MRRARQILAKSPFADPNPADFDLRTAVFAIGAN